MVFLSLGVILRKCSVDLSIQSVGPPFIKSPKSHCMTAAASILPVTYPFINHQDVTS